MSQAIVEQTDELLDRLVARFTGRQALALAALATGDVDEEARHARRYREGAGAFGSAGGAAALPLATQAF